MSDRSHSLLGSVEKLNGNNWAKWKDSILMILQAEGIRDILDPAPGRARPLTNHNGGQVNWDKNDGYIMAIIHLTCESRQQEIIRGKTTGRLMWTALENLYQATDTQNRVILQNILENCQGAKRTDVSIC